MFPVFPRCSGSVPSMGTRRNAPVFQKKPILLDIIYNIFIYYTLCSQNRREGALLSGCARVPGCDRQVGTVRIAFFEKDGKTPQSVNGVHIFEFPRGYRREQVGTVGTGREVAHETN